MSSQYRLLSLFAAAALVSTPLSAPAFADECGSNALAAVSSKLQNAPTALPSYSADVLIHARMHGFPFLGMNLSGESTYERPGKYELLLNNPPRFADGVSDLVHELGEDITSSDHWNAYDASAACAPAGKLLVHMIPKAAGATKTVDLTVDTASAHVEKATFVRNDGTITVEQRFDSVGGHNVIVHQQLELLLSRVKADVTVDYHDINLTTVVAGQ